MHKVYPATVTTGEEYTGNQQFKGMGLTRSCALCGQHRPIGGGFLKHCFGGRHWVCSRHPKAGTK